MRISVLDLGSTTFHAQVFEVDADGQFHTRADARRPIHLGRDVYSVGRIGQAKWDEALATVSELLELTRINRPDVTIAVATSAIRDASNGLAFRVELWNRFRLGVQLLTPEQEARFSYLGASTTARVGGRRAAVIDLGGGSLELAVGEGTRCLFAESTPLGALAVRERLGVVGALGASEIGRVHELVRAEGRELFAQVRSLCPELVVFASGTARSARQHLMQSSHAPGKVGEVEAAVLRHAIGLELEPPVVDAGPVRAEDSVLVAGSIMLATMDMLDAPRAIVSDKGLRDGVALDVYRQLPRQTAGLPVRVWNRRLANLVSVPSNLARRD